MNKEMMEKIKKYKYEKSVKSQERKNRRTELKEQRATTRIERKNKQLKARDSVFKKIIHILREFEGIRIKVREIDHYGHKTKNYINGKIECVVHRKHNETNTDAAFARMITLVVKKRTIFKVYIRFSHGMSRYTTDTNDICGEVSIDCRGQDRFHKDLVNYSNKSYQTKKDGEYIKVKGFDNPTKDSDYNKFRKQLIEYIGDMCIDD